MKVGPTPSAPAETAVARFYKTITSEQRKVICFPFDHPLRSTVKNNWDIVKPPIGDMSSEQQALCQEIMKNLCSEDGYERFTKQMEDDDGGIENYHVAVFGEPGTDKPFEWVLTGRHDTLRADGNSVEGAAFGGPIFYGHAADGHNNEDAKHTHNVWWYQGEQANKIFKTLEPAQRTQALVDKAQPDTSSSIKLKGDHLPKIGLDIAGLDGQQKVMVRDLLEMMLRPSAPSMPPRSANAWTSTVGWISSASLSSRKVISATTAFGTSGSWKVPPSPGTSAARPMSTPGSTWRGRLEVIRISHQGAIARPSAATNSERTHHRVTARRSRKNDS